MQKKTCTSSILNKNLMTQYEAIIDDISNSNSNLSNNYGKFFNKSEILAYTVVIDEDQNILFGSSIARRQFWPKGVYRILNRAFKNPDNKSKILKTNFEWNMMIISQINWLKCNKIDFNYGIITRQLGSTKIFQSLIDQLKVNNIDMYFLDSPVWICGNNKDPSCFQYVIVYSNQPNMILDSKNFSLGENNDFYFNN